MLVENTGILLEVLVISFLQIVPFDFTEVEQPSVLAAYLSQYHLL